VAARDVLAAGAAVLLLHGFFFAMLFVLSRGGARGEGRRRTHAAWWCGLAGWLSFLLGAVVLGSAVESARSGGGFAGWPFGTDAGDTANLLALAAWVPLLLWRNDLFRGRGDDRPAADRVFAILILVAVPVTATVHLAFAGI
jgi:hypothetical protein